MVHSAGLIPDFDDLDEEAAYSLLTTGSEVLRMLRDGDPNSGDERARTIYGTLLTGDSA